MIHILATIHDSCKNSLARLQAKDVVGITQANRAEERVKCLKTVWGEWWVPCMAKQQH